MCAEFFGLAPPYQGFARYNDRPVGFQAGPVGAGHGEESVMWKHVCIIKVYSPQCIMRTRPPTGGRLTGWFAFAYQMISRLEVEPSVSSFNGIYGLEVDLTPEPGVILFPRLS